MNGASRRPAASATVDLAVSHPGDGCIRLVSRYFFANPKAEICQRFIGRIFEVEEVRALEILASAASAQIEFGWPNRQRITSTKSLTTLRQRTFQSSSPIAM